MFLDQLVEACRKKADNKVPIDKLIQNQLKFSFEQVKSASSQNNFDLAEQILRQTKTVSSD